MNRFNNKKLESGVPHLSLMKNNITEVQLLLNQEVEVTGISRFRGRRGIVTRVMADGHTLDVLVDGVGDAFLDVSLVREVRERTQFAKTEQSLGPIANSVVQDGI